MNRRDDVMVKTTGVPGFESRSRLATLFDVFVAFLSCPSECWIGHGRYIWSIALYGAETWTLRKVDQRYLESFEM
jgi:hypothetical protein